MQKMYDFFDLNYFFGIFYFQILIWNIVSNREFSALQESSTSISLSLLVSKIIAIKVLEKKNFAKKFIFFTISNFRPIEFWWFE